jgi:eukaryotic-like serine/threonine-protein kinase
MLPSDLLARAKARVGSTLLRKYRVDAVLGIGGMATVYAATHLRNAKRVAVKMLHPELSVSSSIRAHFQREGYAANSVGHRGVVRVDDDDMADDGTVFIVMELLEGIGVEDLRRRYRGRLPVPSAVAIVEQLLDVLSAAHTKHIFHRDIKPSNLFLTHDGSMKVLDFGIARVRDAAQFDGAPLTGSGELLGTPGFMAPEQALGRSEAIDAQTDVWAASATLFNLVSGELVHSARSPQELRVRAARDEARLLEDIAPHVPLAIAGVVRRGLALEKGARWQTAMAMREALLKAHITTFAGPPKPVTDAQWEPPIAELTAPLAPPTCIVPARPPIGTADTPRPVSDRPVASVATRARRATQWNAVPVIATGLLVISGVVVARWVGSRSGSGLTKAPPFASNASAVATPTGWEVRPVESGALMVASPPGVMDAGPRLGATQSNAARISKPLPTPRDCNPPTTVDSAGVKHPKPWCI